MNDHWSLHAAKWRFLFVGLLMIAALLLLPFILSITDTRHAEAQSEYVAAESSSLVISDSPNAVTIGMSQMADEAWRATRSTAQTISESSQSAATATARTSKQVGRSTLGGIVTAGRGIGKGLAFVGRSVASGVAFVLNMPGAALKAVSNTSVVRAAIRPSDHVEVPIIDPNSPELQAAIAALPPTPLPAAPQNAGPQWPLHGHITTHFGVSHWPYQRTHSGLDISDGKRSPIKPFRPGRVLETVRSNAGLGNHVIVDHGNGVTSVYAHLSSIAVQVGLDVGLDTVLGTEGSTGVSTGTHLHFEIRVNGQAADPRQFISGHP